MVILVKMVKLVKLVKLSKRKNNLTKKINYVILIEGLNFFKGGKSMRMLSIEETGFKNENGLKGLLLGCYQCGHIFKARVYFPRVCPACMSTQWFMPTNDRFLNRFPLVVQCGNYLAGRLYVQASAKGYKGWRQRLKDAHNELIFLPADYVLFKGYSAQETAEAFKKIGAKVSSDEEGYYILL